MFVDFWWLCICVCRCVFGFCVLVSLVVLFVCVSGEVCLYVFYGVGLCV